MEIRDGRAERDQGTADEVETRTEEREERNEGTGTGSGGDSGTEGGGTETRKRGKRKAEGKRGETAPELASVGEPDPVPVRVPGSEDVEVPAPEKPKRTKGGRKKKSAGVDATQVASLIQTCSRIVATRLGDHWVFSEEESMSIAEPLTRIMDRHDVAAKLGEYADYIALVSAVAMTVVPRVMVTREMAMREKPGVKGVVAHDQKPRNEGRTGTGGAAGAAGAGTNPLYVPSDVKRAVAQLVQPF